MDISGLEALGGTWKIAMSGVQTLYMCLTNIIIIIFFQEKSNSMMFVWKIILFCKKGKTNYQIS